MIYYEEQNRKHCTPTEEKVAYPDVMRIRQREGHESRQGIQHKKETEPAEHAAARRRITWKRTCSSVASSSTGQDAVESRPPVAAERPRLARATLPHARDARPAAAAWRAAGGAAAVAGGGPGAEGSPYFLDTSRSGVIL